MLEPAETNTGASKSALIIPPKSDSPTVIRPEAIGVGALAESKPKGKPEKL